MNARDELPELPEPFEYGHEICVPGASCETVRVSRFSRNQIREHGEACAEAARKATLEEAAKICDRHAQHGGEEQWDHGYGFGAEQCAEDIRALASAPLSTGEE